MFSSSGHPRGVAGDRALLVGEHELDVARCCGRSRPTTPATLRPPAEHRPARVRHHDPVGVLPHLGHRVEVTRLERGVERGVGRGRPRRLDVTVQPWQSFSSAIDRLPDARGRRRTGVSKLIRSTSGAVAGDGASPATSSGSATTANVSSISSVISSPISTHSPRFDMRVELVADLAPAVQLEHAAVAGRRAVERDLLLACRCAAAAHSSSVVPVTTNIGPPDLEVGARAARLREARARARQRDLAHVALGGEGVQDHAVGHLARDLGHLRRRPRRATPSACRTGSGPG